MTMDMNSRIVMDMSLLFSLVGHKPIETQACGGFHLVCSLIPWRYQDNHFWLLSFSQCLCRNLRKKPQTFTCMHMPFIAPSPFGQNRDKCLMSVHEFHKFYDTYCINHFPLYKFSLSCFFAIILIVPLFCCQGSYILKQETFRKTKVMS